MNRAVMFWDNALLQADPDRIGQVHALRLDEILFCCRDRYRHRRWATSFVDVSSGKLLCTYLSTEVGSIPNADGGLMQNKSDCVLSATLHQATRRLKAPVELDLVHAAEVPCLSGVFHSSNLFFMRLGSCSTLAFRSACSCSRTANLSSISV